MSDKGLWYFAHPYTCKDAEGNRVTAAEDANFAICCIRSGELLRRGYNIYSPIAHTHPIHRMSMELLMRPDDGMWYRLDNEFIAKTRWAGIILAPGWDESKGCIAECGQFVARRLLIKCYEDIMQEGVIL